MKIPFLKKIECYNREIFISITPKILKCVISMEPGYKTISKIHNV